MDQRTSRQGMTNYDLMRLAETDDEDAYERDELEPSQDSFEEDYLAFYNDCKLKNTTKLDW